MSKRDLCLCHSGKSYKMCCLPLHEGRGAPTPLALMRSRYCAFALGLVNYLIETETTHQDRSAIEAFCREVDFLGLEIIEAVDDWVVFRAILSKEGQDCSFTEKSYFQKIDGKWKYSAGEIIF